MSEQMTLRGTLQGHAGWVTQIATTPQRPDMILSASRGKVYAMSSMSVMLAHCQCVMFCCHVSIFSVCNDSQKCKNVRKNVGASGIMLCSCHRVETVIKMSSGTLFWFCRLFTVFGLTAADGTVQEQRRVPYQL